jgi:hypothetical protein
VFRDGRVPVHGLSLFPPARGTRLGQPRVATGRSSIRRRWWRPPHPRRVKPDKPSRGAGSGSGPHHLVRLGPVVDVPGRAWRPPHAHPRRVKPAVPCRGHADVDTEPFGARAERGLEPRSNTTTHSSEALHR